MVCENESDLTRLKHLDTLGALDLLSGFAPGAGRRCQGRTVDALAQEADEGRGQLR